MRSLHHWHLDVGAVQPGAPPQAPAFYPVDSFTALLSHVDSVLSTSPLASAPAAAPTGPPQSRGPPNLGHALRSLGHGPPMLGHGTPLADHGPLSPGHGSAQASVSIGHGGLSWLRPGERFMSDAPGSAYSWDAVMAGLLVRARRPPIMMCGCVGSR
eukprot:158981-Rhodomonas_salina.2